MENSNLTFKLQELYRLPTPIDFPIFGMLYWFCSGGLYRLSPLRKGATARAKESPHFQKQLDDTKIGFLKTHLKVKIKQKKTISYFNKEEKQNEKEISISFSSYHGYY